MIYNVTGAGIPFDGVPADFGMAFALNGKMWNQDEQQTKLTEAQKEELINRGRDAKSAKERERITNIINDDGISLSPMDRQSIF